MFYIIRFLAAVCLLGLVGCSGSEVFVEEYATPGSREAEVMREERTGDYENMGPNAPGYLGPGGEYQVYPEMDPE